MRVLVIEEDRKLARLIKRVLESERIDADLAFDGDDGVEFALRDVYDVAVVDWMLPGRDGPAVCRARLFARTPCRRTGLQSCAHPPLTRAWRCAHAIPLRTSSRPHRREARAGRGPAPRRASR